MNIKILLYENGETKIVERTLTPEEIAELEAQQPPTEPTLTPEERIAAAEARIAEAAAEIEWAKAELLGVIDTMEGTA